VVAVLWAYWFASPGGGGVEKNAMIVRPASLVTVVKAQLSSLIDITPCATTVAVVVF